MTFLVGIGIGTVAATIGQKSIIIPYIKLPPRLDRFYGDPEVEVEIAGKRTHMRLDTGNAGELMLLKRTSDFLEIKRKFHPLHVQNLDPFQNLEHPPFYNIPLTLVGVERNITVNAPTLLAEDINPTLDNDIIPAHLFLKDYAISFYPDHARFTPYFGTYNPPIGTVSVPRSFKSRDIGYRNSPWIIVEVNGVTVPMLLDSCGSTNMLSHKTAKACGLHKFPRAETFHTTDSGGPLILQGYQNIPVQVPGLPPIFTNIYDTIPNGIYDDTIDGLTTELFTIAGYAVTITDKEVLFEPLR